MQSKVVLNMIIIGVLLCLVCRHYDLLMFPCQAHSVKVQESLAKANNVATETFSSMKTVRSFANEDGETERYRKCLEDTYTLNKLEAAAYAASNWTNSVRLRG